MKKVLLAASVIVLSMTACKKDRVCSCTTTFTSNGVSVSSTQDYTAVAVTKRTAKLACISEKQTEPNGDVTSTDCKLK